MEVNERFLTLLTPDGEFLRARKLDRDYQIGQEIDFFPINQEEAKKKSFFSIFNSFKAKTAFAATLIFMIMSVTLLPFFGNNNVYAYMSIDINPSIELGVNKNFQVIKIHPYNEEGKEIVNQLHDWKKKNIQELTNEIIQEIKAQGYTKNNHEIVIGTAYEKKGQQKVENQQWEKEIAEIRNELKTENLELKIVKGSIEDRNKAKEMGLTMGLYKEKENQEKEMRLEQDNKVNEEKVKQKVLNNEDSDQQRENEISKKEERVEKDNREMHKQAEKEIREKEKQLEKENKARDKQIEKVIRESEKQTEKENRESKKQIEKENKEREKEIKKENKEKQMEKENDEQEQRLDREGIKKQKELEKENKENEKQKIKEEKQKHQDSDD
nr:anti-sigma factor domain-containing protein [Cytobacillus citreus]